MQYDEIEIGQNVIVTTRDNVSARVIDKFKSSEDSPIPGGPPAGTEFVTLRRADNRVTFFNYPHQLVLDGY
jgi:hypothetical protein